VYRHGVLYIFAGGSANNLAQETCAVNNFQFRSDHLFVNFVSCAGIDLKADSGNNVLYKYFDILEYFGTK